MKKTTWILLLFTQPLLAQDKVMRLEECYASAMQNYPLTKQKELIASSNSLALRNLNANYYPGLDLNAQATYQSDVMTLPITLPGIKIPAISKDQYKASVNVRQTIYDGGIISAQKEIQQSSLEVEQQKLDVQLFSVKERVNQFYFNILILQDNMALAELLKQDIETRLNKVEAGIHSGISLSSAADILKAELLKTDERIIELKANRKAFILMLSDLIQQTLPENTVLEKPTVNLSGKTDFMARPEMKLYDLQQKTFDGTMKLSETRNKPKLSAFIEGGYGRPAFNIFDNKFEPYYITGLKFSWNIWNWNTVKNERQIADINRQVVGKQKEIFVLNTNLLLKQQSEEITKFESLIVKDKEIVELRERIKKNSSVQLENGTTTYTDYLTDLNAENQARQNLASHEIQLLLAQITFATTQGN